MIPTAAAAPEVKPEITLEVKKKPFAWGWIILVIILVIITTQITFYTIQPIGALPDGITVVMLRGNKMQLFDSPDAMCARTTGGVSLLCRGIAIGAIKNATILFRLPYIDTFYLWSTGGDRYTN